MVRRIISLGWFMTRLATPWIIRACAYSLWLTLLTMASFWIGIPKTANQIADDWLDRAIRAGWPTLWDRQLRRVLMVVAFMTIVLGWIVLSFITVFIVKLVL